MASTTSNTDGPDHGPPHDPREGMEHHSHFPRVYLIRHGETEWSLNGKHTGVTDIDLTPNGEQVMRSLGPRLVGKGLLLDPRHLAVILLSPRKRAQKTFELLFEPLMEQEEEKEAEGEICNDNSKNTTNGDNNISPRTHSVPSYLHPLHPQSPLHPEISNDIQEWDYGDFEGRKSKDIRKDPGFENWNMWVDGCPNGESPEAIAARADRVVQRVRNIHRRALLSREEMLKHEGYSDPSKAPSKYLCDRGVGDVLLVSHGHFLRVFLARWIGLPASAGVGWVLDAGGVSVGGYEHGRIQEPAILGLNNFALV